MAFGKTAPTPQAALPRFRRPLSPDEEAVCARIDWARKPAHVAVIMDGNGRWARQRSLAERIEGHRAGAESVRAATRTAAEIGLRALTLYAFSSENWKRPRREVEALMHLLEDYLEGEIPELMENNIRLVASGRVADLPASARGKLARTMGATAGNDGLVLNLALSYGGRQEIVDAARALARRAAAGDLDPDAIDEAAFAAALYQPTLGDPELLIRTSGEQRLSNFLLWQSAYTEFVYLPVLWPDFTRLHFLQALIEYMGRDRRFGGL